MGIYLKRYTQDKPPLGSQIDWSHPLSKGLVGCWIMNEGGGLKVNDIARGNNGTISGALWKPAKRGIGLDFDGTNDYVNCGSTMNFTSDQTIVAWIWLDSTNRGGILDKLESSGSYNGFTFLVGGAAFPEKLNYYNNNTDWINGNTLLSINQWYHVAVTVDADVGVSFYLNGVNDRTIVDITSAVTSNAVNVKIGADYYAIPFYLNGKINEVAVWNRALSSSEIQQLYQDPYQFIKTPRNRIYSYLTPAVVTGQPRSYGYLF